MKTNIQFVQMPTSEYMEGYVQEKLEKLYKKYDWIIKSDVFFKKENDPKGNGKICDVELSLSGPKIFATSNEKNFELAVKETISDLEKQLKKRKQEMKPYI
ncbi:ribosome-associated translation inhibitor RaiA [Aquimarina sp. MMG015]|uniref:ribosome hibernation-promoting factor, HPF/YfiA family n=1 Tax=Aquimarina TaxID=290174 RepID=UPI0004838AC7|nr:MULTISPECIES: ribosome-associated translation inhibitor RaiA [Aquimarina]AXT58221.1 ribosome-associated translation inhibitor RaiA [Aquimarina sp. AD1]MBQ4804954.1 ribosome-associated translation inhibitor RaiA [Aquimarina sp. MMG015]RKN12275.1 ribosome-associated translation inhibitor RaiA [Aquimarina sp. AD1]